jgi:hypothetical protein
VLVPPSPEALTPRDVRAIAQRLDRIGERMERLAARARLLREKAETVIPGAAEAVTDPEEA